MNKAIICGRLTRDPEVRYSSRDSDLAIASYTLAVDRKVKQKDDETADFIRVTSFGRAAEFVEKYFTKGMRVIVCGRIQVGFYESKEGQKVNTFEIISEELEFADSPKEETTKNKRNYKR